MKLRNISTILPLVALSTLGILLASTASASVRQSAQQARLTANYRSIAIAYYTYSHLGGVDRHNPEKLKTMEDLLRILAKIDVFDAYLYISLTDQKEFKESAPIITGYRKDDKSLVFQSDILNFPISFSFAVYPDYDLPSSQTPLLWTRGLQNYKSFDKPRAR